MLPFTILQLQEVTEKNIIELFAVFQYTRKRHKMANIPITHSNNYIFLHKIALATYEQFL